MAPFARTGGSRHTGQAAPPRRNIQDDLLKRDFRSTEPLTKCVTDITEIKASDGKLYVSAMFDCFDLAVLGLAMATNMKAPLCARTLRNAHKAYPGIEGAICHSDYAEEKTMPKFFFVA